NFHPAKITALTEDGNEVYVRVIDYKSMSFPGLPDMDYYMVINDADGTPICGYDTDGVTPLWALPLMQTYDQYNGKKVVTVNEFSFNCWGGALEKCNRYGYPNWITRLENP